MANYPQELAQDAVCQSHTGHMTGLWFLPARPLRLNTNERMNEWGLYFYIVHRMFYRYKYIYSKKGTFRYLMSSFERFLN